jgi:putative ABC transport system permease protein
MEHFKTIISEFLLDLRLQKLRTFMTIFGIVWGTVAIVVLLAFGMGFKRQTSANMHGMGERIAIMFPGRTTRPFAGFGIGRPINFVEEDASLLATQVSGIDKICPEYSSDETPIRVGENTINTSVGGVFPIYGGMRNILPQAGGRFINELDIRDRKRVAFIGDKTKGLLFGESDAIGKVIYVEGVPFTVIGIMIDKTQPSSYNRRDADRVFIPATTFASLFGVIHPDNLIFSPSDPTKSEEVISQIRQVLGKRYKFDPEDKDAVFIWDTTELDRFIFYFFLAFDIFMGLIGSFTLAVGGIGVANIMYIVVQERVREIGIKRAVGATRRSILIQFFAETMFVIGLGSAIGFAIAAGIITILQYIPIKDYVGTPELSPVVAIAACCVLMAIGLAAGLMPARKAANLDVVECLRA